VTDGRTFLVAFDLDGTLVDSAQDLADSGNALLRSYAARPLSTPDIVAMVGEGARELVRRLLEARRVAVPLNHALARFLALYDARLVATTRPYEGVVEMLHDSSARARLAVLTNKPAHSTQRLLDAFDLRKYFAEVVCGDGDVPRKPDPAGLAGLVERAGVDRSRALMVGDSPADVQTALNAGVPMCLVRYGFGFAKVSGLERAQAAHEVDRPSAVAAVIARLTAD
jgi:phosphoglycolate phosphatase